MPKDNALTTADEIAVNEFGLRLAWNVSSSERPNARRFSGELYRVAAFIADLMLDYEWTMLVSDGFAVTEPMPGRWRVVAWIRIEPDFHGEVEVTKIHAALAAAASLL
jgi:hypothetical protein